MSEHLELGARSSSRLVQQVLLFLWCTFLSNITLVIAQMEFVREHMHFITEVVSLGQLKAKHGLKQKKFKL